MLSLIPNVRYHTRSKPSRLLLFLMKIPPNNRFSLPNDMIYCILSKEHREVLGVIVSRQLAVSSIRLAYYEQQY